jgi:hypothetical protein
MAIYDRRMRFASQIGTLGITHEQIAAVFRQSFDLDATVPINILFEETGATNRELFITFAASGGGHRANGKVVLQVLQENTRAWSGPAVLLSADVEID